MIENITKTICSILVRLIASRFSFDLAGLFLYFLFAIFTPLLSVLKKHLTTPFPILPLLQVSSDMYRRPV